MAAGLGSTRRWLLAVTAFLATAAACGRHDMPLDPEAPPMLPGPIRAVAVAGIVSGSVTRLWPGDGAPPTVAIADPHAPGLLTWLGHSGFMVTLGGKVVIVDPILDEAPLRRASMGGRLSTPPDLSGLERLDAVLITHEDQDHFDLRSLRGLAARFPQAPLYVPQGFGAERFDTGFGHVIEVAPGEAARLGPLTLRSVPSIHLGRRGSGPTRPAVGWALWSPQDSVLLSGDTAYGPGLAEALSALAPFDLAAVPIGAWHPPRVQGSFHASPEQAIRMALDAGAARAVAHHWGTFRLTPDSPALSVARFRAAAQAAGIEPIVLPVGGQTPIRPR